MASTKASYDDIEPCNHPNCEKTFNPIHYENNPTDMIEDIIDHKREKHNGELFPGQNEIDRSPDNSSLAGRGRA